MYIISKKKDYYDGVAGTTGIDKSIVYERQIIEVEEKNLPNEFKRYNSGSNPNRSIFLKLESLKRAAHEINP